MVKVVITGGAGFVGHHVVEHILRNTDWHIVVFDKLNYASSGLDRLRDINSFDEGRVEVYAVDLSQPISEGVAKEVGGVDYILHLAAESHVDNSIDHPVPFITNNVSAALNMLEYARTLDLKMFVNFSTDEVYGPTTPGQTFAEFSPHHPSNPYSASKSAQESIGIAYSNTYGVPVVTTHTMNIIGERQHPEKYVPKVIRATLTGEMLSVHGYPDGSRAGSRFYLHARNLADALLHILSIGYHGYDEWNIAGLQEVDNMQFARAIGGFVNEWQTARGMEPTPLNAEIVSFHASRPGHDLHYGLDSSKLLASGYVFPMGFEESLRRTVFWTLDRQGDWLCQSK